MRILVLYGNDRSGNNNTQKLTEAFLQGIKRHLVASKISDYEITKSIIDPCKGCNSCWNNTAGKCRIASEESEVNKKYIEATVIIWSLPLFYYGPPSILKAFVDIQTRKTGKNKKQPEKQHVLICACGFDAAEGNYESFFKQFDNMYAGKSIKVLCPQGELLSVPQMKERTEIYLENVRKAGTEFACTGKISRETEARLSMPLYNR